MITLRQLSFLVAVADELSFTRAADICNVSQPTLSAGLRELESRLGVRLVERSSRAVLMTEIGHEISERARELLAGARQIEQIAAAHLTPGEGELRLGAIHTVGPYLLPRVVPLIRTELPRLRLYLREEITDSILEGLGSGRLDLGLIALPYDTGSLYCHPLFDDGYTLAAPQDEPEEKGPRGRELLLLERGHCLQRHALQALPGMFKQDTSFAATSLPTLLAMVSEGLGSTLLPDIAVAAGVAAGHGVTLTPLPEARPRQVALVWRRSSQRGETFERIGDLLRQARARG